MSLPPADQLPLPDDYDLEDVVDDEEAADVMASMPDFDWPEILPHLTGDADIELAFDPSSDGITDPDDPTNRSMAIGDYRLQAWNTPFPRTARPR